jgi:predicted AAA+ superfamily ATPase
VARLIDRRMQPLIEERIDDARIVFVAGARQVGKTTLLRGITRAGGGRPMRELSVAGGFPEARARRRGRSRSRWFDGYVAGSLGRDLKALADVRRADDVEHLLRLLASRTANLFKADPIGRKLGMDHKTVRSSVGLLRQMHLIHQLPGWRPCLGARESTTPKLYVSDAGLLCHLLGADERTSRARAATPSSSTRWSSRHPGRT